MYFEQLTNFIRKLYYGVFDRYVLYPLMNILPKKLDVRFMNLGYLPKNWYNSQFSFYEGPKLDDIDSDDEIVMSVIRENLTEDDSTLAHCFLYEKTISFCPHYPRLSDQFVLEVGCGLGGGIEWLKRAHPEIREVVGLDKIVSNSNLKIRQGEAENLPFPRESFDILLNVESSHLYSSMTKFLEEARRVLKPGGFLCWADLRFRGQMQYLLDEGESEGFNLVHFKIITPQVLRGLHYTSSRYDEMMKTAPWYIRIFKATLRETYCAPGTKTFEQFRRGDKQYAIACWRKPIY